MRYLFSVIICFFLITHIQAQSDNTESRVLEKIFTEGVFDYTYSAGLYRHNYTFSIEDLKVEKDQGQTISRLLSSYNIFPDINAYITLEALNNNLISDVNNPQVNEFLIPYSPDLIGVSEDLIYLNASKIVTGQIVEGLNEVSEKIEELEDAELRNRLKGKLSQFYALNETDFAANKTGYLDIIDRQVNGWSNSSISELEASIDKTVASYIEALKSKSSFKDIKVRVMKDGASYPNLRIVAKLKDYFSDPTCNIEICRIRLPGLTKTDVPTEGPVALGVYNFYGVDDSGKTVTEIYSYDTNLYGGQILDINYIEE